MNKIYKRKKTKIMMIGTTLNGKGGIASVIQGYKDEGLFDSLNIEYFENHGGGSRWKKIQIFLNCLKTIVTKIKLFQIVHLHTASYWSFRRKFVLILISKMLKKKIIIHIHGAKFYHYFETCNILDRYAIISSFKMADIIFCLSPEWYSDLKKIHRGNKIITMPNCVPIQGYKKPLFKNDEKKILFLGRLGARKGIYDLIKASKYIDFKKNNAILYLYGDGEIKEAKKEIHKLNLSNSVKVMGWIEGIEKTNLMKGSYIYVLPSYYEGLPMSILEAMSFGMPIVSTTIGGIPYAVRNGVDGFLVEPGNWEKISEKINLLLEDEKLWHKMSLAAQEQIKYKFSIKGLEKKLRLIYQHLMN